MGHLHNPKSNINKNLGIWMGILNLIFISGLNPAHAEENFAGETYLMNYSVSSNGNSNVTPPSTYSPSLLTHFPANKNSQNGLMVEVNYLPVFDDLSTIYSMGVAYTIENWEVATIFAPIMHGSIFLNSSLEGSTNDRYFDPRIRACNNGCSDKKSEDINDYFGALNIKRNFAWELPRINISQRKIPVDFTVGSNIKFQQNDIPGENFNSSNINMDLAAQAKIKWDYNPSTSMSSRNLTLYFTGFEILGTSEVSEIADEKIESRYHFGLYLEEMMADGNSIVTLGINQANEWSIYPGASGEWNYKNKIAVRAGGNENWLSGGVSFTYKKVSLHYSIVYHELNTSLYQFGFQFGL